MKSLHVNHMEIIRFGRYLDERREDMEEVISKMENTIGVINSGIGSDAWNGKDAAEFRLNIENHIKELKVLSDKISLYSAEILKNGKRYETAFSDYLNRQV